MRRYAVPVLSVLVLVSRLVRASSVLTWNGSSWSSDYLPDTTLNNIACTNQSFCKAAGYTATNDGFGNITDGAAILSGGGVGWTSEISGIGQILYGVSCVAGPFCIVIGQGGATLSQTTNLGAPLPCSPGRPDSPAVADIIAGIMRAQIPRRILYE
jgi:hypothetical protein